jgi:SAM-dependent methyltransferase
MQILDRDRALLMEVSGKLVEAEQLYRRALESNADDRECLIAFVHLLLRQGRGEDARAPINLFISKHGEDKALESLLGPLQNLIAKVSPPSINGHYGEDYFSWQKNIGAFGGVANLFKFVEYISSTDTVVDLGSGGGYLLSNIVCACKLGIEINPIARLNASQNAGIESVESPQAVPDEYADVIISNHALEHMHSPLDVLKAILPKLKIGGKLVMVVPSEPHEQAWDPNDINKHIFTWNPMTLGNLVSLAGFRVIKVEPIQHQWPPDFIQVWERLGEAAFHEACRAQAIKNGNYQIRVVAVR